MIQQLDVMADLSFNIAHLLRGNMKFVESIILQMPNNVTLVEFGLAVLQLARFKLVIDAKMISVNLFRENQL